MILMITKIHQYCWSLYLCGYLFSFLQLKIMEKTELAFSNELGTLVLLKMLPKHQDSKR